MNLSLELVDALRTALAQVTVSEEPETQQALPSPQGERRASEGGHRENTAQEAPARCDYEREANNYERVKEDLATHPQATDRAIADALTISASTANKWRKRIERASGHE